MVNFRIIAIKTGDKKEIINRNYNEEYDSAVDVDFFKIIKPNTIYNFCNKYKFPSNNFKEIIYLAEHEISLFDITLRGGRVLPINISAIVGENGSGKSTLIELLYLANYNLGCQFGLLEKDNKSKYEKDEFHDFQILYSVGIHDLYILKFENGNILQLKIKLIDNRFTDNNTEQWKSITNIKRLKDFFYSVVVNYSQYALNALEVGDWINPLFHKNDGYQTPIVINPMRTNGNININKERLLLSRRLQSNVLEKITGDLSNSIRNIANGKIAKEFSVKYNPKYFEIIEKEEKAPTQKILLEILTGIRKYFDVGIKTGDDIFLNFQEKTILYIYYKLKKIVFRYPIYESFRDKKNIKNIDILLSEIKRSESHITFKVKGAILHLKYFEKIYIKSKINFDYPFIIDIQTFSDLIENEIKKSEEPMYINTYMMALPSFFNVEVITYNQFKIDSLSSGEKQRIYSMSSIIYHLINLNSVEDEKLKNGLFTSYKYINLILDEIELYFHPEWQRKYIFDLLDYIKKISPDSLKHIEAINILFVTHSPYILSDIPNNNILKLKEGNPQPYVQKEQTFGANVHDLLANDFFMENGYIGQWAKQKINEVITFLNEKTNVNESDLKYYSGIIDLVGEPIIKSKLKNMFEIKYPTYNMSDIEIDRKIKIQEEILKKLEEQRINRNNENFK